MNVKSAFWTYAFDPIIRKIESRLGHFQSSVPSVHSGGRWAAQAVLDSSISFFPDAVLANDGKPTQLKIGAKCHIAGGIIVAKSGYFEIGAHCFVGPGSRLWCSHKISIGSHVLISHLVDIHDSDSHSFDWTVRHQESLVRFGGGEKFPSVDVRVAPVIIEDDVWICFKASILKGVTVGRGAIVAAGSVVTRDVAPYTLVAGNPARPVRDLKR